MATFLAVGDYLQFRMWSTQAEQASVSTFNYHVTSIGSGSPTDFSQLALFCASADSLYKAILQNNANYNGTECRILGRLLPPIAVADTAGAGAGTGGAVGLPRQSTGMTTWYSNFAGSANRGRTFWPFPPTTDDINNGVPSAAYLTDLENLAVALWNQFTTAGLVIAPMVVLSRVNPAALQSSVIDHWENRPKWATQKRRGSYGRANTSPI